MVYFLKQAVNFIIKRRTNVVKVKLETLPNIWTWDQDLCSFWSMVRAISNSNIRKFKTVRVSLNNEEVLNIST